MVYLVQNLEEDRFKKITEENYYSDELTMIIKSMIFFY